MTAAAALDWLVLTAGALSLIADVYLLSTAARQTEARRHGGSGHGSTPEQAAGRLVRLVVCGMAATNAVQSIGFGRPGLLTAHCSLLTHRSRDAAAAQHASHSPLTGCCCRSAH